MARVKSPHSNQVFFEIKRRFRWEGFCRLNVRDAFGEIGYSKSEVNRLLKNGAIKIWDTRVTVDGMEWYKRPSELVELVEPDDVFIFGKPKVLTIKQIPFSVEEIIYYKLRDTYDIIKDKVEDAVGIKLPMWA